VPNIRIDIEYDGSGFCGWQWQPGLRSIQETLQRALETVLREKISVLYASGRTDAGVHARRQTCSFKILGQPDLQRMAFGVTSILRGEIAILSAEYVADEFNARRSSKRKQYRYVILNRRAHPALDRGRLWHVPLLLDFERLQHEAKALVGSQDFRSFQAVGCQSLSTVKEIYESEWTRVGDELHYRVVGNAFLKQMVRNIVGTQVDLCRGALRLETMADVIAARDRKMAGQTAPAMGLYLDWVGY
jgi:tRNA pseudouridine38-40 synthase